MSFDEPVAIPRRERRRPGAAVTEAATKERLGSPIRRLGRHARAPLWSNGDQHQYSRGSARAEFIDENGGGPGLRLRKRHQKKS
jgi:hypothetical protein